MYLLWLVSYIVRLAYFFIILMSVIIVYVNTPEIVTQVFTDDDIFTYFNFTRGSGSDNRIPFNHQIIFNVIY